MGYFASLLLSLVFGLSAAGADLPLSQERQPYEDWTQSLAQDGIVHIEATSPDVLSAWPYNFETLQVFVSELIQVRFYDNPNPGDFMRLGPWLYPANGCYAKAAHVSAQAKQKGFPQPGKIYAYGNLQYDSPYSKNGRRTYWRYHVAAAYVLDKQVIVIDPGVSSVPLTEYEWLSIISPTPDSLRVKYCDRRNYSPLATCVGGSGNGANLSHVRGILRDEWSNLNRLGYNPRLLLGP